MTPLAKHSRLRLAEGLRLEVRGASVSLLDRGREVLAKVRISGGGRCNVTHACFDPKELAKNYPRGSRELLAAFHRWQPADTVEWFKQHGVVLKTEADGRMFPVTDSSETIIACFLDLARRHRVGLHPNQSLTGIEQLTDGTFSLHFDRSDNPVLARAVRPRI